MNLPARVLQIQGAAKGALLWLQVPFVKQASNSEEMALCRRCGGLTEWRKHTCLTCNIAEIF